MESAATNSLLSTVATQLTCEQVIKDKTAAMAADAIAATSAKSSSVPSSYAAADDEDDEDMEDDPEYRKYKEKRIQEMRAAKDRVIENKAKGHGDYREINETEFLGVVTKSQRVVCHFYHREFERCKIVDEHLKKICMMHLETRFVKIDCEKAPFFVGRLQIKVLPTLVCFIDGVAVDRVVGFEELGQRDDFPTLMLIRRLVQAQVVKILNKNESPEFHLAVKKRKGSDEDES